MKIHLKKILVSLLVIIGFVFYAGYQRYFIGQQTLVTNPTLDTAATQTTSDMVSSTTVSQAETLPPTDTTAALGNNGISDDGEYDDEENGGSVPQQTTTSSSSQTSTSSPSSTTTTSGSSSSTTTTTTVANALYKDGQYDGNTADAYYGLVQVRVIIQGGKLTDVQFLRYPNDRSYSIEINTYAMPILKSEAIKAQSATVNIVTGATNTSRAFVNSLSNALGQTQV